MKSSLDPLYTAYAAHFASRQLKFNSLTPDNLLCVTHFCLSSFFNLHLTFNHWPGGWDNIESWDKCFGSFIPDCVFVKSFSKPIL